VTPRQIVDSAIEAAKAGASIVHLHVRDPKTGQQSMDLALYRETYGLLMSSGVDVIVNLTTGPGATFIPSVADPSVAGPGTSLTTALRRVEHILELKPEICSLDVGTMNFYNRPYVATPEMVKQMATMMREAGVKPELECFDSGHIRFARTLIEEGYVVGKPLFQIVLGVPWNAPATPASLGFLTNTLPPGAEWSAFGVSSAAIPMAAQSLLLGGHVRIGLEDTLYLTKGQLAPSNAALVKRVVELVQLLGGSVATPQQARELLGLPPRRK
jgi:uncharacterized protein (DUF849 family)